MKLSKSYKEKWEHTKKKYRPIYEMYSNGFVDFAWLPVKINCGKSSGATIWLEHYFVQYKRCDCSLVHFITNWKDGHLHCFLYTYLLDEIPDNA